MEYWRQENTKYFMKQHIDDGNEVSLYGAYYLEVTYINHHHFLDFR